MLMCKELTKSKRIGNLTFKVLKLNEKLHSHIRTVGAASTVLLKNSNKVLPLTTPKSIGIIGNGAGPGSRGPNGCVE